MRSLLALLLLSPVAASAAQVYAPALLEGAPVTVSVYAAAPGARVALVASPTASAPYYCPPAIAPTCTGLGRPARVLGTTIADGSGYASFTITAPSTAATGVWLQAVHGSAGAWQLTPTAWTPILDPAGDDDADLLSNADEVAYGTDPLNPDSDGDTVPDGHEIAYYGTDPLSADTDGGGVSDGEEIYWQSTNPLDWYDDIDPWSRDSDGDGLWDGEETTVWGTDPFSYDTDYGGVGDGDEVWAGTNPHDGSDDYGYVSYDSDGDGLTDDDEWYLYGTDPYSYDTDYGGVGDGDEIWAGTNPLDSYDDYGYGGGGYDFDGDGLSDDDERYVFGTDLNLYDTDGGGLGDGEEVWSGRNPLDPSDDWY
jgi:hypothetical protein